MQISIAREQTGVPAFRKFGGYTAFSEGWGFTPSDWAKIWASTRIPIPITGGWRATSGAPSDWLWIPASIRDWNREQMVDFFHDHSAIDETSIQAEVDRYIAWPSQALAYKIGQLKILELRDRAKKALGDKFDIRAFHDQVIDSGALPLDVLDERINAWIASQGGAIGK